MLPGRGRLSVFVRTVPGATADKQVVGSRQPSVGSRVVGNRRSVVGSWQSFVLPVRVTFADGGRAVCIWHLAVGGGGRRVHRASVAVDQVARHVEDKTEGEPGERLPGESVIIGRLVNLVEERLACRLTLDVERTDMRVDCLAGL